jgi:hypothetical protein
MAENNNGVTRDQRTSPILGNVGPGNPGVVFDGSGRGVGHMKKHIVSTGRKSRTWAFPTSCDSTGFARIVTEAGETGAYRIALGEAMGSLVNTPEVNPLSMERFISKYIVRDTSKV